MQSYDDEIRRVASAIRSAQPLKHEGEDIVYSMIERHSGKASQPSTTRRTSIITLIIRKKGEPNWLPFFTKYENMEGI